MEGVEKMFKCIINKFRKNSVDTVNAGKVISDILSNKVFFNPFEHFKIEENRYEYTKKISFYLSAPYYRLRQLIDIDVLSYEEYSSVERCRIVVKLSDYKEIYENEYIKALHKKLKHIKKQYDKLTEESKIEFDSSYMESLISIRNAMNEAMTDEMLKIAIEVVDLILEGIKEENEVVAESHVEKLKFELEYLKKIKETRESFFGSVK